MHQFGTRFARVLHEFPRAKEFGTCFARTARVFHEFCTRLAHILHEFCMRFARVLHEFGTDWTAPVTRFDRSGDEMPVLFRAHACLRAKLVPNLCKTHAKTHAKLMQNSCQTVSGASFARVLHEFCTNSTSFAHILDEFCMNFARVLHAFCTRLARVFCTQACMCCE